MHEEFIRLENVGRTYNRGGTPLEALRSVTCTVMAGDRIAVLGPSGSGKSTLLHILGGLDSPSGGTVQWPIWKERGELRPKFVAYVLQTMSLFAPLTVVENVELPLLLEGVDKPTAREMAREALRMVELASIADKLPDELSGGQAQRVAVARAMSSKPKVILADEPTGQLDRRTANRLFDVLLGSLEASDTALVVATHDPVIASRMKTVWRIRYGSCEAAQ